MYGIQALDTPVEEWLNENTEAESWQYLGGILWMDSRSYAEPIYHALLDDGFVEGQDFNLLHGQAE